MRYFADTGARFAAFATFVSDLVMAASSTVGQEDPSGRTSMSIHVRTVAALILNFFLPSVTTTGFIIRSAAARTASVSGTPCVGGVVVTVASTVTSAGASVACNVSRATAAAAVPSNDWPGNARVTVDHLRPDEQPAVHGLAIEPRDRGLDPLGQRGPVERHPRLDGQARQREADFLDARSNGVPVRPIHRAASTIAGTSACREKAS